MLRRSQRISDSVTTNMRGNHQSVPISTEGMEAAYESVFDGLPAIPPSLRGRVPLSAEARDAKRRVDELAAEMRSLAPAAEVAFAAGDADQVRDLRRREEDLAIEMWAAERKLAEVELADLERAVAEANPVIAPYGARAEALRLQAEKMAKDAEFLRQRSMYLSDLFGKLIERHLQAERRVERLKRPPAGLAAIGTGSPR